MGLLSAPPHDSQHASVVTIESFRKYAARERKRWQSEKGGLTSVQQGKIEALGKIASRPNCSGSLDVKRRNAMRQFGNRLASSRVSRTEESLAAANAFYTPDWIAMVTKRWAGPPQRQDWETPEDEIDRHSHSETKYTRPGRRSYSSTSARPAPLRHVAALARLQRQVG